MAKLILSLDDLVLQEIPLTKERTTIGRKPHNDIQIDNLAVSGEHAVIVTIMNDCILEDLGSTNGTLVNGVLAKKHILQNNDVIELGKYKLKFLGIAAAAAPMPAPEPADYEKTMVWRPGGVKPGAPADAAVSGRIAQGVRARPAFLLPGHSGAGGRQGRLCSRPGDHSSAGTDFRRGDRAHHGSRSGRHPLPLRRTRRPGAQAARSR